MFFCLFVLQLNIPVNSEGHVWTLFPFYGTSNQHLNFMTPDHSDFMTRAAAPEKQQSAYAKT